MLYGQFDVPETIDVDDATPEAFKTVLRYIYTDDADLTPDNAFPVLYLAKKYLLNNLVARVSKYVATVHSGDSVAKVLPHLHLLEGEHAETVWDAINMHAREVLKSPEFLELSQANLCDILRRDLNVDELIVYNSALTWAQAECTR
ncbi:hypothetical protein AAVH_41559 [Aphelenchoides avenae]|nr:hypothetical protein AAVH_41559 [Aphelenchus avenae]